MNDTTVTIVKTRVGGLKGEKVNTELVISWEGMTRDDLIVMARKTLTIKRQDKWRLEGVPAREEINAIDYRMGTRAPKAKVDPLALFAAMDPEQQVAFLEAARAAAKASRVS